MVASSKKPGAVSKKKAPTGDLDVAQLLEAISGAAAALSATAELLRALIERSASIQQQVEAVLASQRRTNSLLELALGSAVDAELGLRG